MSKPFQFTHLVSELPKVEFPNRHVILRAGNGCEFHPDCFSCPLDDCRVPLSFISGQYPEHRVSTAPKLVYFDGENISGAKVLIER